MTEAFSVGVNTYYFRDPSYLGTGWKAMPSERKSEGAAAFRLLNSAKKHRGGFSRGPFETGPIASDRVLTQTLKPLHEPYLIRRA